MKKKLTSVLAVSVAMSAFLAGCGSNNNNTDSASPTASATATASGTTEASPSPSESAKPKVEPFTMTVRHINIGDPRKFRFALLNDVLANVKKEIPEVSFELDGVEDSVNRFTKLPAEMAAGNPPKIFSLFGGAADAQKYAKAGRLLDLTDIISELGLKDKFQNVFGSFSVDGKIYGLPIGGNTEGIFYNKELFEKNGLQPPTTWEALTKAADTLKAKGITPFAEGSKAGWVPNMLVNTLIGRIAGDDTVTKFTTGEAKWNSPEVVAVYQQYADWEKAGYFSKGELGKAYDDMLNDFVAGKAGMIFDGSWRNSAFTTKLGADGKPAVGAALAGKVSYVALAPVPNGKGDQTAVNANYGEGYGFSADLNDNEKAVVKSFIKNLFSDEMQLRGLLEDGVLPSMKLSDESLAKVDNPLLKEVMDVLKNATNTVQHFDQNVSSKVNTETETQIQKLIAGKATAQQAGDAIQKVQEAENAAAKSK